VFVVVEILMMGGRTPETCWAVNKRQDNKLKDCCIWLVIYLNCTMMHGLTNLKLLKLVSPISQTQRWHWMYGDHKTGLSNSKQVAG
jgi:hypothetical protein